MQKKNVNINVSERVVSIANMINDNNNPAVNQIVIELENRGKLFVSYSSLICYKKGDIVYLSSKWNFSQTTRKHLYMFMRDELGWQNIKKKKDVELLIKESNVLILVNQIVF